MTVVSLFDLVYADDTLSAALCSIYVITVSVSVKRRIVRRLNVLKVLFNVLRPYPCSLHRIPVPISRIPPATYAPSAFLVIPRARYHIWIYLFMYLLNYDANNVEIIPKKYNVAKSFSPHEIFHVNVYIYEQKLTVVIRLTYWFSRCPWSAAKCDCTWKDAEKIRLRRILLSVYIFQLVHARLINYCPMNRRHKRINYKTFCPIRSIALFPVHVQPMDTTLRNTFYNQNGPGRLVNRTSDGL